MAMADVEKQLSEARAARHKLLTGTAVVKINKGGLSGMSVEYSKANLYELNAYISELETKVNGIGMRRPPAGISF
ncbi:MAG: gpW family protein [Thalassotalea sp.]|nr:gpW family protein [Thalassotalea sp.]